MLPQIKRRPPSESDAEAFVAHSSAVLERLRRMCAERGLDGLADNLSELLVVAGDDMAYLEEQLLARDNQRLAERAATHLLQLGGKRLRPLCVALAARTGRGFNHPALELAIAVELVHNATLLHDDVIDMAASRRGAPAARAEFGNAASIFAGDWLLIEALKRVRSAGVAGTLDSLLETIAEMIRAESVQLENRSNVDLDQELYFSIAEGKSATLFRWAMHAGALAGGHDLRGAEALARYGLHLGVAFQVIDDLLDITGGPSRTGKARFTDLREGKMTFPVILALEQDKTLRPTLEQIVSTDRLEMPAEPLLDRVANALERTGAIDACRSLAAQRIEAAIASLDFLSPSPASRALAAVARSTVHRLA